MESGFVRGWQQQLAVKKAKATASVESQERHP